MTLNLDSLLLIGALVCFGLATVGLAARINFTALGLFLWALTLLV